MMSLVGKTHPLRILIVVSKDRAGADQPNGNSRRQTVNAEHPGLLAIAEKSYNLIALFAVPST